jgi:hypothetical protein
VLADLSKSVDEKIEAEILAIKPPSNYGEDAKKKWHQEKGGPACLAIMESADKMLDEAIRKTALDGSFGEICVIGLAADDKAPVAFSGEPEADMLHGFNDWLNEQFTQSDQSTITVVGHNVLQFDLRFLFQRYVINGIRPHAIIRDAVKAKPWDNTVFDTMTRWAGTGNRISLDKLCKALNVKTPKGEITGATVWDFVKAGKIDDVMAYCLRDIEATRTVYSRMVFA